VTIVFIFFAVYATWGGLRYFGQPWAYTVNDETLIAERLWGHDRVEIRWSDVARVTKIPRPRVRTWPFVQVESRNGQKILIGTHLRGYQELVKIIRERAVNCEGFEVYMSMTDKS